MTSINDEKARLAIEDLRRGEPLEEGYALCLVELFERQERVINNLQALLKENGEHGKVESIDQQEKAIKNLGHTLEITKSRLANESELVDELLEKLWVANLLCKSLSSANDHHAEKVIKSFDCVLQEHMHRGYN